MAERRMFAKAIIDSDAFLDMPLSTQALYFHLAMRADDEGFVGNPKKIQRMIGASDDDCKVLIMKRFILTFESGIIVIKHWKIHNYIQADRFKETTYIEERDTLTLDGKKAYTECIHSVSTSETQVSIGKDRDSIESELGKHSLGESGADTPPPSPKRFVKPTLEEIIAYCQERNNRVNPQGFFDFYEAKGWKVGNQSMKDWRACIRTWEQREQRPQGQPQGSKTATASRYDRED